MNGRGTFVCSTLPWAAERMENFVQSLSNTKTEMTKWLAQLVLAMVWSLHICEFIVIIKSYIWAYISDRHRHRQGQHKFSTVSAVQEIPDSCPYWTSTSKKTVELEMVWPGRDSSCTSRGFGCSAGGSPKKIWTGFLKRNTEENQTSCCTTQAANFFPSYSSKYWSTRRYCTRT